MKTKRVFDILYHQLATHPRQDCLAAKSGKAWRQLSTTEVRDTVNRVSLGLLELGIGPGDKVAIAADNSIEWVLADLALQQVPSTLANRV